MSERSVVILFYPIHFWGNMSHYCKGSYFVLRTVSEMISVHARFTKEAV